MFRSALYKDKGHHICTVYFKSVLSQSLAKRELGKKAFCVPTLLSAGPAESNERYSWQPEQREKGFSVAMALDQSREDPGWSPRTHIWPQPTSPCKQAKGYRIFCNTAGQEEMVVHCCLGLRQTSTCLRNGQSEDESTALKKVHPPMSGDSSKKRALHMVPHSTNLREQKHVPLGSDLGIPLILNFSAKIPWLN